jgi:ribosome maturation factor RimP
VASADTRGRLRALVEPPVASAGYELEDIEITPVGRRDLLRVVVDRDGGVDLDGVAVVSRTLAAVLDGSDLLRRPYVLEVTSPGVDRPLTEPRHWRRARGRLVRVRTPAGELTARVVAAGEDEVTFATHDGERTLPIAELGAGRVQVEFR